MKRIPKRRKYRAPIINPGCVDETKRKTLSDPRIKFFSWGERLILKKYRQIKGKKPIPVIQQKCCK
jgi:hypothetical protein